MDIVKKIENYVNEKSLNEASLMLKAISLFSDDFKKLVKLSDIIEKMFKGIKKDDDLYVILKKIIDMMDRSGIDDDILNPFRASFLRSFWKILKNKNPTLSGLEIKDKYNIDNDLYVWMNRTVKW